MTSVFPHSLRDEDIRCFANKLTQVYLYEFNKQNNILKMYQSNYLLYSVVMSLINLDVNDANDQSEQLLLYSLVLTFEEVELLKLNNNNSNPSYALSIPSLPKDILGKIVDVN